MLNAGVESVKNYWPLMCEPSLVLTFKYKSCRRLVDPGADASGTNECSSDSISALK